MNKCIGIIGGVGLYEMEGLSNIKEVKIETPFGDPSDLFIVGELNGVKMVFLPRHGREHTISPSEINSRANIYGMKQLGVEWIIGVSAVGSLKEDIMPGEILIVNQYVDRTRGRISTFFTDGIVAHVSMADPTCPVLNKLLLEAGKKAVDVTIHPKGTYLCMEGPQFSTRAESNIYRMWGLDVIGMTNMPEAKLAREAEICYSTIAIITDYDCWYIEKDVDVSRVIETLFKTLSFAKTIIKEVIKILPDKRDCVCSTALKDAIVTKAELIPSKTKERLAPIIGKYIK